MPRQGSRTLIYLLIALSVLLGGCNAGKTTGVQATAPVNTSTTAANREAVEAPAADPVNARARAGNRKLTYAERAPTAPRKLTWQAPLTREDGSSLYPGEILGYRIYFKKNHHDRFQTIPINDPSKTSLSLESFSPGVYQFAISTLDINGLESQRSVVIRVSVT